MRRWSNCSISPWPSAAAPTSPAFVLIDVDGIADVDAQVGVLDADELIVAVAAALTAALPAGNRRPHRQRQIRRDHHRRRRGRSRSIRAALDVIARPGLTSAAARVSAHAGFAQAPRHATTRSELTRRAELALRAAAKKGPGAIVGFEMAIDAASTDQKFIQRELPRALEANESRTALPADRRRQWRTRWSASRRCCAGPTRCAAPIAPAVFIPVAEQMGLMDALGAFVLRRALHGSQALAGSVCRRQPVAACRCATAVIVDLVRSALHGKRRRAASGWCWKSPRAS